NHPLKLLKCLPYIHFSSFYPHFFYELVRNPGLKPRKLATVLLNQASILSEIQSEQGFQKSSGTAQEQFTNSSFEFVNCVSDTLTGNSREGETAHAPLRGASPQTVQGVSEKEKELPVVTDCTTLALVDAASSQSTSLLAENQDCGVEQKGCHEGGYSAASVAQNEFYSKEAAIANQTQRQVEEQDYSASLLVKNSVSGVDIKADHEGVRAASRREASAAPVTEKWSHEAIVARSNMRPVRREKLNRAANSGENPGFDFLQECWDDDPALQIVIKGLVRKYPQWGYVVVDGELMDWEKG
ncbi:MAG: hypothetical protein V7L19_31285, partial [Nostoc sp.]